MPRKKGPKTKKIQSGIRSAQKELKYQSAQDVSIHEYANAPKPTSRPKKFNTIPAPEILESWELAAEGSETVHEVDEEGEARIVVRRDGGEESGEGVDYPEVVWYLVSRHVRPEDVGRFAGINRATYAVTRREGFWRALYGAWCAPRRHLLPAELSSRAGGTLYALRQRVVRALFYTYGPFLLKLRALSAEADPPPHALVGRRCVTLWYDKRPDCWLYTFKLRRGAAGSRAHRDGGDWLRRLSDMDANPELHCQALLVECEDFHSLPAAMGLTLSGAAASLASSLRHQRLRLEWGAPPPAAPDAAVRLERVRRLRVLDWWHPRYPHAAARLPPPPDPADGLTRPLLERDFLA